MSTNFNDLKKDFFKGQQSIYSSETSVYDLERAALSEALGIDLIKNSEVLNTWRKWFYEQGYENAYTDNLTDLWWDWLTEKGFTQSSLREKFKAFYESDEGLSLGIFDNVKEGLAAVYSPDKVVGSYSGPTVRLRRSVDNVESDFTAKELYDGTAEAWTGVGNLVQRSQEFDNAYWSKSAILSTTANVEVAPDTTTTADVVIPDTTNATHAISTSSITVQSSMYYTYSLYAKPAGYNWITISEPLQTGSTIITWFDVQNGVVGTTGSGHTARITSAGNGWYRCSITFRTGNTITSGAIGHLIVNANNVTSFAANGTSGIYFWGAQLNGGIKTLTYTSTTHAAVVRDAFVTTWYNQNPLVKYAANQKRALFYGSVGSGAIMTSAISFAGEFDISCKLRNYTNIGTTRAFMGTTLTAFLFTTTTNLRLISEAGVEANIPLSTAIPTDFTEYTLRIVRNASNEFLVYLNGVAVHSSTVTSTQTYNIDRFGVGRGRYWDGVISDINIDGQAAYTGYGVNSSDWRDTIGSNHVTSIGSMEYIHNQDMKLWMDGFSNYIQLTSTVTLNSDFNISFDFYMPEDTNQTLNQICFLGSSSTANRLIIANNLLSMTVASNTYTWNLPSSKITEGVHNMEIVRTSGTIEIFLDGVSLGTNSDGGAYVITRLGWDSTVLQGTNPAVLANYMHGSMWNININDEVAYVGNGPTPGAWIDTIGSNHGTVTGVTSNELLHCSGYRVGNQVSIRRDAVQTVSTRQFELIDTGGLNVEGPNLKAALGSINVSGSLSTRRNLDVLGLPSNSAPQTLFGVGKKTADGTYQQMISMNISTVTSGRQGADNVNTIGSASGATADAIVLHGTWVSATPIATVDLGVNSLTPMIASIRRSGGLAGLNSTVSIRAITTATGVLSDTQTQPNSVYFGQGAATIGVQGNTASVTSWPEDIQCIAIYSRAITDDERTKIEANLRKHYGI